MCFWSSLVNIISKDTSMFLYLSYIEKTLGRKERQPNEKQTQLCLNDTLCHVVLCYVTFCIATLRYVTLRYVTLCYVMLCYVMLCNVMLWCVMLCYRSPGSSLEIALACFRDRVPETGNISIVKNDSIPVFYYHVVLCYFLFRYVTLRYATLRYVTLRYIILCYVMLWEAR